ncbi:monothiol glutaredoxin grx5 [Sorochytrium milnesiophthora]
MSGILARAAFRSLPSAAARVSRLQLRLLSDQTKASIENTIKANDVCIFMKGTQQQPMCGFSRAAVQIMEVQGVEKMKTVNVLEDNDVREGIKEYSYVVVSSPESDRMLMHCHSQWPTIPQVYIKGEFVGGADILLDMHRNGQLEALLVKEGIVASEKQE